MKIITRVATTCGIYEQKLVHAIANTSFQLNTMMKTISNNEGYPVLAHCLHPHNLLYQNAFHLLRRQPKM